MNFLKKIFGGGSGGYDDHSIYVYVRPKRCDQIVLVRIDLFNDLSQNDLSDGYFVRKIAQAARCPFQAEITLEFDKNRKITDRHIENGEFATEEQYKLWLETKA
jgi:hypothetical protein